MSRVPRIRFKGFEEDWEQRKHGEVFIYLRNNTLSREELNDEDGFAQSIHYGDVLIKYGECLNVSKELLPYIDNKNIVNKFKKFYIQNGDVIIADTAEDETVGKCIEISGIVDHNIISGLHTIPLRPVNKFAYGYLGFYLNSNSYHNQLKPLMQGIKVTSISKNLLKTTTLNYPSNIQEQKIIGRYFDALNHLITLHQRKLEKLKIIKKSMLENLFPQNGEKTPKIRFSGFTKDWEQRKLISCLSLLKDGTHGTHKDYPSGPLLLSAKNIKNGRVNYDETDRRISYKDFEKIHSNFKLQVGDVLLTIVGSIGETALLQNTFGITFQRSVAFLRVTDNIIPEFLMSEINTSRFKNELENRKSTSAQPGIYLENLGEIPVFISKNSDEQLKIGSYFDSLNHLITLHQSKLEKLQKIKKSMLESMFV